MALSITYSWICCFLTVLLHCISNVRAELCSYHTEFGFGVKDCPQVCCINPHSELDVCCEFKPFNGVYVGVGVGTIILLGCVLMCATYFCCKHKIMQHVREDERQRRRNSRLRHHGRNRAHDNQDINAVSANIIFNLPPPYDTLQPPPYTPTDSTHKDNTKTFPDHPPPEYTELSEQGQK